MVISGSRCLGYIRGTIEAWIRIVLVTCLSERELWESSTDMLIPSQTWNQPDAHILFLFLSNVNLYLSRISQLSLLVTFCLVALCYRYFNERSIFNIWRIAIETVLCITPFTIWLPILYNISKHLHYLSWFACEKQFKFFTTSTELLSISISLKALWWAHSTWGFLLGHFLQKFWGIYSPSIW